MNHDQFQSVGVVGVKPKSQTLGLARQSGRIGCRELGEIAVEARIGLQRLVIDAPVLHVLRQHGGEERVLVARGTRGRGEQATV